MFSYEICVPDGFYNSNHTCLRCGTSEGIQTISGLGCWFQLCKLCRQERKEIQEIMKKYQKLCRERNRRNKG
jgi:hypothetical protein